MSRKIVLKSPGQRHGPITRLISPGDIGQLTKPFVFLDFIEAPARAGPQFGFHPHSGIATLTSPFTSDSEHETSTGRIDRVHRGGLEWVIAGGGIRHRARPLGHDPIRGFQLWISLPPSLEQAEPSAEFIEPGKVPKTGPVTVLFGSHENAIATLKVPFDGNYLRVCLKDGDAWTYQPPGPHNIAWAFATSGVLEVSGEALKRELAVFEEGNGPLQFRSRGDCDFLLGSAVKHPHELVLGPYSVHTSREALAAGMKRITEIGVELKRAG